MTLPSHKTDRPSSGILFDIRKYSIHDGPGIRTAIFFKGCPLRCAWCHNPESISFQPQLILHPNRCISCDACIEACPNDAVFRTETGERGNELIITDRANCKACGTCAQVCYAEGRQLIGRRYSLEEVLAEIESDRVFYEQSGGGVTFTGGEPMGQRPFLLALLQAVKARGIHTALDTSGYYSWQALEEVRPFVDLFLYDLKLMDDVCHRHYTSVSNARILQNLCKLARHGHALRVRIPIIPGVSDREENLRASGQFLASLPGLQHVDILAYHNSAEVKYQNLGMSYSMPGLIPPSGEHMEEVAAILRAFGLQVSIGG